MPGDSIIIHYGDTTYVYAGSENLPPALDTLPLLKQLIAEQIKKVHEKETEQSLPFPVVLFLIFLTILVAVKLYTIAFPQKNQAAEAAPSPGSYRFQTFSGTKLHFEARMLHRVLSKFFLYYRELAEEEQKRFLKRLQVFMKSKVFTVPADDGYREMPILVSASAIQLTFGLEDFMLPWYEFIWVHPREYMMVNPLRTLAGNVTGKTISLSWKHFLEDYQKKDGVNLGLHEMAHALQMQHEYFYKSKGENFRKVYDLFESLDEYIRSQEKPTRNQLYTDYALKNTDEFWASSVELFFEQPDQLKEHYPQIYTIIKTLLKQDPSASVSHPRIL